MPKIDLATLNPRLQAAIKKVTGMRAKRVIDHILAHGQVTTEDLANMGYEHAPRAARDVRESGVPLVTARVLGAHGKKIASYTFGNPAEIEHHKMGGRQVLPKGLRDQLYTAQGERCAVCGHRYEARYLQVDHRVPYEIAGEAADPSETEKFMLLCATCQRKKSWSCEQCVNRAKKAEHTCATCYWADPVGYQHVATESVRTMNLTFAADEAQVYDEVRATQGTDVMASAARDAILGLARKRRR
jgi:hypothetical protein